MKKKILVVSIGVIVLLVIGLYQVISKENSVVISNEKSSQIMTSNAITMMYETEAGSGEYQASDNTTWPQSGYTYNETLSACENGSTLIWNEENKTVQLQANISDKCYVYFDVYVPTLADLCSGKTLAECIIENVYTTDGANGLYYHDDDLSNGAGDYSYRYSGASAEVDNYVCFGSTADTCPDDNLYRIIGLFDDDEDETYNVKLIKYDYATSDLLGEDGDYYSTYSESGKSVSESYLGDTTSVGTYYWNNTTTRVVGDTTYRNIWSDSALNTVNLNKNFLDNIGTTWSSLIDNHTWKVGGTGTLGSRTSYAYYYYYAEILEPDSTIEEEVTAKVGLMYLSDYGFAASSSYWTTSLHSYASAASSNWMFMGLTEWSITRNTGTGFVYGIEYSGDMVVNAATSSGTGYYAVRPVFYLVSSVALVSGDGTYDNPYRIS